MVNTVVMKMTNTAELIRITRKRKEMYLSELSELTGVSTAFLNYVENDKKKSMNMELYRKICKALDISRSDFIKAIFDDLLAAIDEAWTQEV